MTRFLLILLLCLPSLTMAQSADYGTVRLLNGWKTSDGSYQIALEFNLNPGWKTYWRAPGSAGLPPLFDWQGSGNIESIDISWPTPEVFDTAGFRSIGYKGTLVLPIRITPQQGGPVRVALNLQFGVCSDICVPAEAFFLGRIDGQQEEGKAVIRAALRDAPDTGRAAGLRDISCRITPIDNGFSIEANLSLRRAMADPVVVIEYDDPDIWISESDVTAHGRQLTAMADLRDFGQGALIINRNALRVTVLDSGGAFEVQGCPG